MKLKGIIAEVGRTTEGVAQATGKQWVCRDLSLLVPYTKENGEVGYDNIVAGYFGDLTDAELREMVESKAILSFTVQFTTNKKDDRRFQCATVWGFAKLL